MCSNRERVKQIIPADGWFGVYWEDEHPFYTVVRLIGWALWEHGDRGDDGYSISALDTGFGEIGVTPEGVEEAVNFLEYIHEKDLDGAMRMQLTAAGREAAEKYRRLHGRRLHTPEAVQIEEPLRVE